MQTLVDVYDNNGIPIAWQRGDIAAICNTRFAHGRLPYTLKEGEERELGVILGELFPRLGPRVGKW